MRQRRAEAIRDQLEQDILTGVYPPGERLDEAMLANRFAVSRTPIREALLQLAAHELVNIEAHRGAFVRAMSLAEILSRFEVMAELEGMCARLSARRRTPAQLAELESAQAACRETLDAGDADEYYYANERFHSLLYAASGNDFLARTASSLQARLRPYRRLQLRTTGRMRASSAEHDAILTAIRDGDAVTAERITEHHIAVQGERFGDFLAALEAPSGPATASHAPEPSPLPASG